jgi:hypothetical protein
MDLMLGLELNANARRRISSAQSVKALGQRDQVHTGAAAVALRAKFSRWRDEE